ncbi:MAG: hypothetical protein M1818_007902 [Claussenomyces sp. TS43310]|nr:MAG: hypothetical protein M1818_007902 [Claussenomyces sp. TS43310]
MPDSIPETRCFNDGTSVWHPQGTPVSVQNAALYDMIASKFNVVVTSMDKEFSSQGGRMQWNDQPPAQGQLGQVLHTSIKGQHLKKNITVNDPGDLKYLAKHSAGVYNKPTGKERAAHVDAGWWTGTKAMTIKSVAMDDMNVIVFAICGTRKQNLFDWMVNMDTAPSSPMGFLDDGGNFCHAGFLSVARKMIRPVAERLRFLLHEDPRRSESSLLITGHSAGGAVAALLYSHMLSTSKQAESKLNILTGCFKRLHCITFGAPPISLLPLVKPEHPRLRKSLFYSFINEGDLITRADKAYVKSLIALYCTPAPGSSCCQETSKLRPLLTGKSSSAVDIGKTSPSARGHSSSPAATSPVTWRVPTISVSNAGRLILLRSVPRTRDERSERRRRPRKNCMDDGVQARSITDEQLRAVIWGDLDCHKMELYARRIEVLATNAVIGRV